MGGQLARSLDALMRWMLGGEDRVGSRNAALDGIRGVAVLLVTINHAGIPVVRFGGTVGLTLFFALSGYLITTILLKESSRGGIRVGAFYARRALRLLPALLVAVTLGGALAVITDTDDAATVTEGALASLGYIGNLRPWTGIILGPFHHYWSLSMEEQFYFVWPALLVATRRLARPKLLVGLLAAAGLSLVLRFATGFETHGQFDRAYHLPHTNAWAILLGAALAVAVRPGEARKPPTWAVTAAAVSVLACATLLGLVTGLEEDASSTSYFLRLVSGPLAVTGCLVLIYTAAMAGPLTSLLRSRLLVFFGTISYGLYLWHAILDDVFTAQWGRGEIRGAMAGCTAAVVATVVAVLSMRYVETPFLRLKTRFEKPRATADSGSA